MSVDIFLVGECFGTSHPRNLITIRVGVSYEKLSRRRRSQSTQCNNAGSTLRDDFVGAKSQINRCGRKVSRHRKSGRGYNRIRPETSIIRWYGWPPSFNAKSWKEVGNWWKKLGIGTGTVGVDVKQVIEWSVHQGDTPDVPSFFNQIDKWKWLPGVDQRALIRG